MNVQTIRFCIVLVVLADLIESEDFISELSHYSNILRAFGVIMQLLEPKVGNFCHLGTLTLLSLSASFHVLYLVANYSDA
jgi:hypothetical protein